MRFTQFVTVLGFLSLGIHVSNAQNLSNSANPMVGTGGHGHTFPGATVPFGMIQLSPDTRVDDSWDGCSGYHYSDSLIYGFSHTHLSGTGCSDYGDIVLSPVIEPTTNPKKYRTAFSHANEKVSPGFYSVKLNNGIDVELSATTRAGIHRYKRADGGPIFLTLDLNHRDQLLEGSIEFINDSTIGGIRRSKAWAEDQYVYYTIEFSRPFRVSISERSKVCLQFRGKKDLIAKVGLSSVSQENAKLNVDTEIPSFNFDLVKRNAESIWTKALGQIKVAGNDEHAKVFYSAFYHTMIHPSTFSDVNGQYRGMDKKVHQANGVHYTVFSLWDTFRALNPLWTLLNPKLSVDFINTMLEDYQASGLLPVWELSSNETYCMIGYHSVPMMAEAMNLGLKGFDYKLALEASMNSANKGIYGLNTIAQKTYLELEDEHESVSKALEYAYDDYCISLMAEKVGNREAVDKFKQRSQYYINYYDPKTKHFRPRTNGGWLEPFDAREVNNNYTEGNSWQYSFFVPQDIFKLQQMMGGEPAFAKKVDDLFNAPTQTTGREQADITGLIGQYAHGNEPSHHMAFLYNFTNQPHKTQDLVSKIRNEFYSSNPDGLIGNEDCGQMSAWLVWTAMGLYPFNPAADQLVLVNPWFDNITVNLSNGKDLKITSTGKGYYIQSVKWNGVALSSLVIAKSTIANGGELSFTLGEKPNDKLNIKPADVSTMETTLIPPPVIESKAIVFEDSARVSISNIYGKGELLYQLNEESWKPYSKPFYIKSNAVIKALVANNGTKSVPVISKLFKKTNNWRINTTSTYNKQYAGGGKEALIDGLRGNINWKAGFWQGYQEQDYEAIIDLKNPTTVNQIIVGVLQDTRAWILYPTEVIAEGSLDGITYQEIGKATNTVESKDYTIQIQDLEIRADAKTYRYIRVKAKNAGKLPEWHAGAGYPSFIFLDEIKVK